MATPLTASQRQRFPSLAHYLDRVPQGLSSYPDCQANVSLVRSMLEEHSLGKFAPELPPPLAELILQPPPLSAWMPEVHLRAILRIIHDRVLTDRRAFVKWTYDAQKRLLSGPMYRLLFSVMSMDRLGDSAPSRWTRFHRGSTMQVEIGEKRSKVSFAFPPHLFDDLDLEASLAGLQVAIEMMVGKSAAFSDMQVSPTSSCAVVFWR